MINKNGQASLEFLLVFAAFFMALILFLPAVSYASEKVFQTNTVILAKSVSNKLNEECSLFYFLGDGSKKTLNFINNGKINFNSNGKKITVSTMDKEFSFECISNSFSFSTEETFNILIKKVNGVVSIVFE